MEKIKNIICVISFFTMIYIAAYIAIGLKSGCEYTEKELFYLTVFAVCVSYLFLLTKQNYKMGFHFIIFTYMNLCQFGFVIGNYINPSVSVFRSVYTMRFQTMQEYPTAIQISIIFIIMYAIAALIPQVKIIARNVKKVPEAKYEIEKEKKQEFFSVAVYWVGMSLLIIGGGFLFLAYWYTRGMVYSQQVVFLNRISWYGHIVVILSLSFTMILASGTKKQWSLAAIPYSIIIVIHLMMGNRGEILYALVTCLAIYQLRYKNIKLKYVIFAGIALILIIPFIRVSRQTIGAVEHGFNFMDDIIETISEIGFQICPMTYTVELIKKNIKYRHGATYLYGIMDFIGRRIPFIGEMKVESANNIKYMMPQDGLGYSQVAEFYYNFGILGGAIAMVVFGYFICNLETSFIESSTSRYKQMFNALFIVELVNLTRNSSGSLMLYLTYIFILMLAVYFFSEKVFPRFQE